jgi:hypothetical protein
VVAGYCGLRWAELAALRWTDIVSRAYSEEAPRGATSPVKDHRDPPANLRWSRFRSVPQITAIFEPGSIPGSSTKKVLVRATSSGQFSFLVHQHWCRGSRGIVISGRSSYFALKKSGRGDP